MDSRIKVGIAGFGRSGYGIHARHLRTDPRFEIAAVADELEERRGDAVSEFGCRVYRSAGDMIAAGGFDLLVNATPSRLHAATSIAGLRAGFHVLGEKPSAATVDEFDAITDAAEKAGRMFLPFQNSRFYPYFRKICEVVSSGRLGKIICIRSNWSQYGRRWDWQTRQDQCAGNLFNTGPHPVDQAIVLFGDGMPQVFCRMASYHFDFGGDADNFCALTLYGEDAPTIEIQISSFQAYAQGDQYNIQGTLGGLAGGPSGLRWKYFDPARAPKHTLWRPWSDGRRYCSETLRWQEETWSFPDTGSNADGFAELCAAVYDNVYDVLVNGAPRIITLDQVRRQIYVMEEAHRQNPLPRIEIGQIPN